MLKKTLAGLILMFFAASCASQQPGEPFPPPAQSPSQDQVASSFVNALFAGNVAEATKNVEPNTLASWGTNGLNGFAYLTHCEYTNLTVTSRNVATPSPAQKANGFGDSYAYDAVFAYRKKASNSPWTDGGITGMQLVSYNGRWFVTQVGDWSLNVEICR